MTYRIRRSEQLDAEVLGQIHSQVWHESYAGFMSAAVLGKAASVDHRTAIRYEMFATSSSDCFHIVVENEQHRILGFGDCGPAQSVSEHASAEIYCLYLLKEAQGKGFGKAMLMEMFRHLSARGFDRVALRIFAQNEKTLDFYRHLQGREVARTEVDFAGTRLPLVIFAWTDLSNFLAEESAA